MLKSELYQNPLAFDSDYTWEYPLKLRDDDFNAAAQQIERSTLVNSAELDEFLDKFADSLSGLGIKGIWTTDEEMYKFHEISASSIGEDIHIEMVKSSQTVRVNVLHQ